MSAAGYRDRMPRDQDSGLSDYAIFEGSWTISGLPSTLTVEVRLRTARRFLREMETMVAKQTQFPGDVAGLAYDPFAPSAAEEIRRWEEATAELPLLAWATTLGYCFSTLEAFLQEAAQDAANLRQRSVQRPRRQPVIEAWLEELERLGFVVRDDARTMNDLRALRRIRNALLHGVALTKATVPPDLRKCFEASSAVWAAPGSLIPTSELVRRALATVESVVAAVDYALAIADQHHFERWEYLYRAWATRAPE